MHKLSYGNKPLSFAVVVDQIAALRQKNGEPVLKFQLYTFVYFLLEVTEWERDSVSAQQRNSSMAQILRAVPVSLVSDVVSAFTGH